MLVGVGVLTVLLFNDHPNDVQFIPPCPWFTATGLRCPGCGVTRAVHFIMRGDIWTALSHNPLVVFVLPLTMYWIYYWGRVLWFGRWFTIKEPPSRVAWGLFYLIVMFWAYRIVVDLVGKFSGGE